MKVLDNGIYRDMTAEELMKYQKSAEKTAEQKINELKQKLKDTDFEILKVVEGATTLTKIAGVIKNRAEWRREIERLEGEN